LPLLPEIVPYELRHDKAFRADWIGGNHFINASLSFE
jgi:hypothetical protein